MTNIGINRNGWYFHEEKTKPIKFTIMSIFDIYKKKYEEKNSQTN